MVALAQLGFDCIQTVMCVPPDPWFDATVDYPDAVRKAKSKDAILDWVAQTFVKIDEAALEKHVSDRNILEVLFLRKRGAGAGPAAFR